MRHLVEDAPTAEGATTTSWRIIASISQDAAQTVARIGRTPLVASQSMRQLVGNAPVPHRATSATRRIVMTLPVAGRLDGPTLVTAGLPAQGAHG